MPIAAAEGPQVAVTIPQSLPSKHRPGRGLREEGRPLRAAAPVCNEEEGPAAHLQNQTIKLSEQNLEPP